MAINERSEIERKYKIGDDLSAFPKYRSILQSHGFKLKSRRIETDYLPDTADGQCKAHKLLLRFRKVETNENKAWILTVKTRKDTAGVLDFREIETLFAEGENETFERINEILQSAIGLRLPSAVLRIDELGELQSILKKAGLPEHRILLDKFREEYTEGTNNVTLDYFPDGMGAYLEVESHTVQENEAVCSELNLGEKTIVTDDYGDLLKLHKAGLPDKEMRTALFGAADYRVLLEARS